MGALSTRALARLLVIALVVAGFAFVVPVAAAKTGALPGPLKALGWHGSAARAATGATGAAGILTPVQARLVDTRNGTGGRTGALAANTWTAFQALGQAGIPSSGVSAIAVTVTVVGATGGGNMMLAANTATSGAAGQVLQYETKDVISNTAMVAVGSDGKVAVKTTTPEQVLIDVQGYFSSGSTVSPGGFVPVTSKRVVDTRNGTGLSGSGKLANGSTTLLHLRDVAAVPGTATAVYANVTVIATAAAGTGAAFTMWPATDAQPGAQTSVPGNQTTGVGRVIDIDADGNAKLAISGNAGSVDVLVDIEGYFDGQAGTGTFTPASSRIYDSNTASLAAGGNLTIQVTGVNGLPSAGSTLAAVALNLTVVNTGNYAGNIVAWPSDATQPSTSNVNFASGDDYSSSLALIRPATSSGQITVHNGGNGPIRVIVDAQGWYTNNALLVFPYMAANPGTGNRDAASMVGRSLNDSTSLAWNPTNGNLLVQQSLLHLGGVGADLDLSWRDNSINDRRPTLNVGTYETALETHPGGSVDYIADDGGFYTFAPDGSGTPSGYTMPADLDAVLTRVSNTEYTLRFIGDNTVNVYDSNGATYPLTRSTFGTGSALNTISYAYNTQNNLTSITDTQGRRVTFAYNDPNNLVQPSAITDTSLGRTWSLAYNGAGSLKTVTDPTGAVTSLTYTGGGAISSITDPDNERTAFSYDTSTGTARLTSI